MKSIKNLQALFAVLLFIFIIGPSTLYAQESSTKLKDFKISIEMKGDEIIMSCKEGCAWLDLSYQNGKTAQAIDEYGMTEVDAVESQHVDKLSDFLFTVSKTTDGVALKGFKGTAWIELSFSLQKGQKQMINQLGMMDMR